VVENQNDSKNSKSVNQLVINPHQNHKIQSRYDFNKKIESGLSSIASLSPTSQREKAHTVSYNPTQNLDYEKKRTTKTRKSIRDEYNHQSIKNNITTVHQNQNQNQIQYNHQPKPSFSVIPNNHQYFDQKLGLSKPLR